MVSCRLHRSFFSCWLIESVNKIGWGKLVEIEKRICALVEHALADPRCKEFVEFPLSEKTVNRIWRKIRIDLRGFKCRIHADEIRHVRKEHGDETEHICKVPHYLEKFFFVERSTSTNAQTRRSEPALVFKKRNENGTVRMVKINRSKDKTLSFKTIFGE
jgi:hypothetical protein